MTTTPEKQYICLASASQARQKYFIIIKFWFKILLAQENKYIRMVYELMLNDFDMLPNKNNWASLVRNVFMSLCFYDVWLDQGVGNYKGFMTELSQRLTDNFV